MAEFGPTGTAGGDIDRRKFLKGVVATAGAAALPALLSAPWLSVREHRGHGERRERQLRLELLGSRRRRLSRRSSRGEEGHRCKRLDQHR